MRENNKCLVCTTPHREWIEQQSEEGRSARDLSKALKDGYDVDISHSSISNHLSKHMDGDSEMAELEARIRNLEIWMGSALPPETFVTWFSKLGKSRDERPHRVSYRNSYMQTVPNPETIHTASLAILRDISARMDETEAEQDRQQKEAWAREKAERDRLAKLARDEQEEAQKKARAEAKRVEIETMREQVNAYDNEGVIK